MPVRVIWLGGEPEDHEQWEDILNAEYGNALGSAMVRIQRFGDGWELTHVDEESPAPEAQPRIDASRRFVTALRDAGKPVLGESTDGERELETVTADALSERAEAVRRRGGSTE